MATKDDRPNLLSKVAMFVRNPTKDWSELDHIEPEPEPGYDKQALKAMIERKRQNDFVRKREFDQLRKMRNRDAAAMGAQVRPSVFQSSLASDIDGRAVTLKKIDEIEAQMSKQWWKGKQEAGASVQASSYEVTKRPSVQGDAESAHASSPPSDAQTMAPDTGFEPTAIAEVHDADRKTDPMPVTTGGVLNQVYEDSGVAFSTSRLFAMEVDEIATDPELEEAAIRFANGDDAGAESGLLEALRAEATTPEAAQSWACALLDLHCATHQSDKFAQVLAEFQVYFGQVKPRWVAIGAGAPSAAPAAAKPAASARRATGAIWDSPVELTAQDMERLRDAMSNHSAPWHIDWSSLSAIEPQAMALLGGLFASLCAEQVVLSFSGAERLVQALQAMAPSGDRSVATAWWSARLDALRAMRLQDEFELAALDYCVTFEVAPPAWEDARCIYESIDLPEERADAVDSVPSGPSSVPAATEPMGLGGASVLQLELGGQILGDATQALAGLERAVQGGERIVVNCSQLVRIDFSAAGSILNWAATRQSEGCLVQFRGVHRLVAAFFNVIGINEHAQVVPRHL